MACTRDDILLRFNQALWDYAYLKDNSFHMGYLIGMLDYTRYLLGYDNELYNYMNDIIDLLLDF